MEWKKAIEENIRTGLHELMILKLLSEGDMYGYEIGKQIWLRTNKVFEYSSSNLYGNLYRLEFRGLITGQRNNEPRVKKIYHLEKSGEEYLAYGLEQSRIIFGGYLNLMNMKEEEETHTTDGND